MRIADPYRRRAHAEAPTTRRVLERVPEAHLNWRPHAKSMSFGQLALHVATLPRQLTEFVTGDALDFSAAAGAPPTVSSHQELMAAFAASTEQAQAYLATFERRARNGDVATRWPVAANCSRHRALPFCARSCSITGITIGDSCSSTLRLLDVPVPSVYGPTADENPFADA